MVLSIFRGKCHVCVWKPWTHWQLCASMCVALIYCKGGAEAPVLSTSSPRILEQVLAICFGSAVKC